MTGPSSILPDHPAYSVDAHLRRVKDTHASYALRTKEPCDEHTIGLLRKIIDLDHCPEQLLESWKDFIDKLYHDNDYYLPYCHDLRLPSYLERLERHMTDPVFLGTADRAVIAFFKELTEVLPASAFLPISDASLPGVPLIDLMPNPRGVVALCIARFSEDCNGFYVFPQLRSTLSQNRIAASGYDPDLYKGQRLTSLADYKGGSHDLANSFLNDTPFIGLLADTVPFIVPRRILTQHTAIFAPTGHGKTQLLQSMIAAHLQEPEPPAMFIIDNMGTMLQKIERLQLFDGPLKDRLVVIDPRDTPSLNLFGLTASNSLYFYLFKSLEQSLTPRQATMIGFLMALMRSIPGATLTTLRHVCEGQLKPDLSAVDELTRDFFTRQFYGKDPLVTQTKQQITSRLYSIAGMGTFHEMLSAPRNDFDPFRCMNEGKIVLISTDSNGLEEASPVFGRFMIAQIMAAARRRAAIPEDERRLALLIIDEAKTYFDEKTEEILADARQFGLGLVFATQHLEQLPDGVRKAMYGNTAVKLVGKVGYGDSISLAREMDTTPEFLRSMQPLAPGEPAEFAAHVNGLTSSAIRLYVSYGTLESLPTRTAPPRSNPATTERTVNVAEPRATPPPQPEQADAAQSPDDLDKDRWS